VVSVYLKRCSINVKRKKTIQLIFFGTYPVDKIVYKKNSFKSTLYSLDLDIQNFLAGIVNKNFI
jgi:hypothetical protein